MTISSSRYEPHLPFHATLTPYRSLSSTGFLFLMAAVGVVSFISGMVFLLMGAWPVTFFFGLDVLLVYLAFRLNYRDGNQFETVDLTRDALILTQHDGRGRSRFKDFNPAWVNVVLDELPDGRTELALALRGEKTAFGAFLSDDERRDFADALKASLVEARGGVRI